MWALDVLGLPDDADERAIKRAYAKLLKTTRPDEDPEGFQRLHDAYRYALDYARDRAWREVDGDEDEEASVPASVETAEVAVVDGDATSFVYDDPVAVSESVASAVELDATLQAREEDEDDGDALDLPTFLNDCIAHLSQDDPTTLRQWLEAQPALWSLQMKPHIGR